MYRLGLAWPGPINDAGTGASSAVSAEWIMRCGVLQELCSTKKLLKDEDTSAITGLP